VAAVEEVVVVQTAVAPLSAAHSHHLFWKKIKKLLIIYRKKS
jgi:hypothetical protein